MLKYPGKKYHAKILLFGEYTVITHSAALTVPYRDLSGRFCFPGDISLGAEIHAGSSTEVIRKFAGYIADLQKKMVLECSLSTDNLMEDVEKGLYFMSDIPVAYGVGSSGALCAAVYDNYCADPPGINGEINETALPFLKKQFAFMESYFHGKSSGIDPLSCYMNKPLFFHGNQKISQIILPGPKEGFSFFLADTQMVADTGPLVSWFMDQQKNEPFCSAITGRYIPVVERNIRLLIEGDSKELFRNFKELSLLQLYYFGRMIPAFFSVYWKYGLASDLFYLKLCGSGGGGYILGYTGDILKTEDYFNRQGIKIFRISI